MKQLMLDAGYSAVEAVGLPTPVMEFSFFVIAIR
jgi:hypothetical protein